MISFYFSETGVPLWNLAAPKPSLWICLWCPSHFLSVYFYKNVMCGTLSHPTLLQCNSNQVLAALPVMQVSVQRLFPAMSQLLRMPSRQCSCSARIWSEQINDCSLLMDHQNECIYHQIDDCHQNGQNTTKANELPQKWWIPPKWMNPAPN